MDRLQVAVSDSTVECRCNIEATLGFIRMPLSTDIGIANVAFNPAPTAVKFKEVFSIVSVS